MRHLNYNFIDQRGLLRELGKVRIEKPEVSTKLTRFLVGIGHEDQGVKGVARV